MNKIGHYISGKHEFAEDSSIDLFNPNNGEKIGIVSCANKTIIEKTINSSNKAFNEWKEFFNFKELQYYLNIKFYLKKT